MIEFTHTVNDPNGMHARPAGLLVKEASRFESEIMIHNGDKSASAKKLIALMSLAVKCGTVIHVTVVGPDEKEAADHLERYLKAHV